MVERDDDETWYCDSCQLKNKLNDANCKKCNAKTNLITIRVRAGYDLEFRIYSSYSSSIKIEDLIKKTARIINKKCYPKVYIIEVIRDNSFIGKNLLPSKQEEWSKESSKLLTEYEKNTIMRKGLNVSIQNIYIHKINKMDITCKYIKQQKRSNDDTKKNDDEKNDDDFLKCPIYKAMKIDNKFTENNLNHLYEFTHFSDEYKEKENCKYHQKCKSFVRLKNGGYNLDDRCHMKLYNHPPRNDRQIELEQNMNVFIFNTNNQQNYPLCHPTDDDRQKYGPFKDNNSSFNDGYVDALIEEVIKNGFKTDLCLQCSSSDDCKHNTYSILLVVDDKLNDIRHKQMSCPLNKGEMLALILYTGGDCNYDLCKAQRNKNYKKWVWFDYCLWQGISNLGRREKGAYKLYSGLNKVKLNKKNVETAFFPTYTSTSWSKEVAISFMFDEGMIIEIEEKTRNESEIYCCDVSWISKFPNEREILIARSIGDTWNNNNFALSILDESNGIQTVSLTKHKQTKKEELLDLFGDQIASDPQYQHLMALLQ